LEELAARLEAFIREWNEKAHAFKWTSASGAKLIERYEQKIALTAGATEAERGKLKVNEKGPGYKELEDHSLQRVIT
jgi:hypothetical protein